MRLAGGLALALLAAAWADGAAAQDVPTVISPLRVETDHNNVNLVTGKTTIEPPSLSVPGAPNLRFDRVQNAAPYVSGTISGAAGEVPNANYSVHAGGAASESFRCPDYDCESVTGTGSTFQPSASIQGTTFYRQAGSAARHRFDVKHVATNGTPRVMFFYASSVTWPSGETIGYSYDTAELPNYPGRPFRRPNRVQSNLGYHIIIAYHPGELGTQAWNMPSQATLYADAAPTVPLQRLTYSLDGATITDLGGRVVTCANCGNSMGANVEVGSGSLTLPREAAPALQATALAGQQVVASVNRDGVSWSYAYTNLGQAPDGSNYVFDRLTVTGPNGFNQVYEFNQLEHRNIMESATDSIGRTTQFTFDQAYRPTRIVYPEQNEVSVLYDGQGNVTERRMKARPGTGLADIVQTAFYPEQPQGIPNLCTVSCWRPSWSRDALNRQTDYLYNANGQLIQQDEPADASGVRRRTIVDYTLSPNGQISRRSKVTICGAGPAPGACAVGQQIVAEYEYVGDTPLVSLARQRDLATGAVLDTVNSYDAYGRLTSSDGPLPGSADATYARYDVHGRRTWEIGAAGEDGARVATRTTYRDSDDKVLSTETGSIPDPASTALSPLRRADLAYDARRNPVSEALWGYEPSPTPGWVAYTLLQRSFDDRGQALCEARRMNPSLFASPPSDPCQPGAEGAHGPDRITRNVYDEAGQRLQHRVGVNSAASGNDVEGAEATWAYNLNGQVIAVIDGNGNRAELRYDGHMRQDRWTFPSTTRPSAYSDATPATALATAGAVNASDYEGYGYDAAGNRTSLRKRSGQTINYAFDNLNRMTLKDVPSGAYAEFDIGYTYDLRSAMLSATSTHGHVTSYSYDAFGRTLSETGPLGTKQMQYDAGGRTTRLTWPDGFYVDYTYDPAGRMREVRELGATSGPGLLGVYSYDNFGRLASLSRGGGYSITTYSYFATDWLWQLGQNLSGGAANDLVLGFSYNRAGGISQAFRDNGLYAWQGHYQIARPYTTNGLNQYAMAGATAFAYDPNGNLVSDGPRSYIYTSENRLAASASVNIAYEPLGRLHQLYHYDGATEHYTRFDNLGDRMISETYLNTGRVRRYVHGPGTDEVLVWYENAQAGNSDRRYPHRDERGSTIAHSGTNGELIGVPNRYDEYGIPAATNVGRFQYTGQIWLAELGMYYYKARVYSPYIGRFLQVDPIGYDDQFNLYAYVGNDPVNSVDPTGMATDPADQNTNPTCGSLVGISAACSGSTILALAAIIGDSGRRQPSRPPTIVEQVISFFTFGEYTPEQVASDIDNFFEAPISNGLDVAAAFPGGRAAGAARSGIRAINFGLNPRAANHVWRHVIGRGLNVRTTQNAILRDARSIMEGLEPGQTLTRTIQTQGRSVQYRIHRLPDGRINIGSIRPPR